MLKKTNKRSVHNKKRTHRNNNKQRHFLYIENDKFQKFRITMCDHIKLFLLLLCLPLSQCGVAASLCV